MCIFYTDGHDVDEDLRTLVKYGGPRDAGNWPGITLRFMVDGPLYSSDVASSNMEN